MAEIKIKADSNGGTVSLKGPATTTGDAAIQLTLPVDDGAADQYLKTDGSGALSWATVSSTPEGTAVMSTGEAATKFLRADGDGTCSWQIPTDTGKILQVVGNLNTGGGTCSTSTDWTETYITDTITPTTTGSKIAVFATGMGGYIAGTGHANMTIGRNVNSEGWSYLGDTTNGMAYIYGSTTHYTAAFSYLDSPTYTSGESIEYSIFMKVGGGTVSAHCIGNGNSYSPIILMEVAA